MPSDQAQSCRNFQLALLFLAESKKGRDSSWHPYLQTLPQHVDSLVHWSDTELHELQYGATEPEQQFLQEVRQMSLPLDIVQGLSGMHDPSYIASEAVPGVKCLV